MRALVTGASGFVGRYLVDALRRDGVDVFACGGPHDAERGVLPDRLGRSADACAPRSKRRDRPSSFISRRRRSCRSRSRRRSRHTKSTRSEPRDWPKRCAPTLPSRRRASSLQARPRSMARASRAIIHSEKRSICAPPIPTARAKPPPRRCCSRESRSFGLDVVIARAFNHIGPGQNERFVVASLAAQLARIAAGGPPQLFVGNLDAARDFLDVRDVVAAYVALARDGERGGSLQRLQRRRGHDSRRAARADRDRAGAGRSARGSGSHALQRRHRSPSAAPRSSGANRLGAAESRWSARCAKLYEAIRHVVSSVRF